MGVLLQNTGKLPDRRVNDVGVSMGVNLSADTSRLEVCFGGFAPTAMNAGMALDDIVDQAEARMREHREMRERAAALEEARASEPRTWEDSEGSIWHYVVLDGKSVRVQKCQTAASRIAIPSLIEE